MIFDTHAHYDSGAFNADRFTTLEAVHAAGVGLIVNPGCEVRSSQIALGLAENFDFVYAAVGIHPEDMGECDPEELARIFRTSGELGLQGGILVTNPIPEEYSMDDTVINKAIDDAIDEMNARGIHGKEATPFLLAKVKELTGGDSLDSNIHLVFNNAKVASQIASCLCRLG